MKQWLRMVVPFTCMLLLFSTTWASAAEQSQQANMAPKASSAVLLEADTGTILYEKNSDEKLPPASITKVMTMLLAMEAIERGELKLTDKVKTSEHAASMGGSQIFLQPGEEMTVDDMLKGIAIASGNDASVAIAEHIAGTEEAFVARMNERAKQLGMKNTHFVNPNGLPAPNHYSSAMDIAIMSRELLKHEQITKYTGTYQDYLRKDSGNPFWLVNTNRLVRFYSGVDGLKTGYTREAGFCLTATAKRDNMRVLAVVMGEPNPKTRNAEITGMFNYAFNHYQVFPVYQKGEPIQVVRVDKGKVEHLNVITDQKVSLLTKKGENPDQFKKEVVVTPYIKAPVKKEDVIGHIFIKTKDGKEVARINLFPDKSVEQASMWEILKRTSRNILISYQ